MDVIRYSNGIESMGQQVSPDALPPLRLDGCELAFIRIDHQVRLQFADTEVVIGTPFRMVTKDEERILDPEVRELLGELLALYPASLISAVVQLDLTLRLTFDRGRTIDVPQDAGYEAWHLVGPGERLIVCPPAGTALLSVWS